MSDFMRAFRQAVGAYDQLPAAMRNEYRRAAMPHDLDGIVYADSWQPWETFPKDGLNCIGWSGFDDRDPVFVVCWFYDGEFRTPDENAGWRGLDASELEEITHWMRPRPPKEG